MCCFLVFVSPHLSCTGTKWIIQRAHPWGSLPILTFFYSYNRLFAALCTRSNGQTDPSALPLVCPRRGMKRVEVYRGLSASMWMMHWMKWWRGGVCPPWDTEGSKPGTKRIAQGLRLFYQRHLAQVTITCRPAAPARRCICIRVYMAFTLYRPWLWTKTSCLQVRFPNRSSFFLFLTNKIETTVYDQ